MNLKNTILKMTARRGRTTAQHLESFCHYRIADVQDALAELEKEHRVRTRVVGGETVVYLGNDLVGVVPVFVALGVLGLIGLALAAQHWIDTQNASSPTIAVVRQRQSFRDAADATLNQYRVALGNLARETGE